MALATYADLLDGIRDWLARSGDTTLLPDTRLGDFVVAAETEIYDTLRVDAMEASANLTLSAQAVELPADFIEARRIYLDGSPILRVEYRAPSQFWVEAKAAIQGRPYFYTIEGRFLKFGPIPDMPYTGKLHYYARPASLATALNAIFTARPTLFLFGALKHAALFTGMDPAEPQGRAGQWAAMFQKALADAQAASDRGTYSATPLAIRPG